MTDLVAKYGIPYCYVIYFYHVPLYSKIILILQNFIYINKKVYLLGYMDIFFMKNVKVEAIGNATKLFTKRSYNAKKAIVQLNR